MASKWPPWMFKTPGYSGVQFDTPIKVIRRMRKIKRIFNVDKHSR